MKFGIVLCTRCQRALGFELRFKSTKCPYCNTAFKILPREIKYQTDTESELALMISKINQELEVKREYVFSEDFNIDIVGTPDKSKSENKEEKISYYEQLDPIKRIAIKFKDKTESLDTVQELVTQLCCEIGEFSENDFRDLLLACGFDVGKTEEYLDKLKEYSILYEPRTGIFKLVIND